MRHWPIVAFMVIVLWGASSTHASEPVQLAEPFGDLYSGDDATGDHVVALWSFDAEQELGDSSGGEIAIAIYQPEIPGISRDVEAGEEKPITIEEVDTDYVPGKLLGTYYIEYR